MSRFFLRLFCSHETWVAPKLSLLQAFEHYPFRIQCKRCGKTKKIKGKSLYGFPARIDKPFSHVLRSIK